MYESHCLFDVDVVVVFVVVFWSKFIPILFYLLFGFAHTHEVSNEM